MNRLQTASDTGGWARTFQYDRYGNVWTDPSYTGPAPGGATANIYNNANQVNGGTYDAAGNVLLLGASALTYDAENRQVTVTDPPGIGSGTETYSYDGLGQRVEKSGPNGATVYVYDALGQLAAEYSTASVTAPCSTCYLSADHLGSTRLVTDGSGAVIGRHDFYPFGEEIAGNTAGRSSAWGSGTGNVYQRFTGQERDQETGLDFFQARYLSAAQGRFTSPDPANAGADVMNPQSWNAYSYVWNNPLTLIDPTGTDICSDGSYASVCVSAPRPDPIDPCILGCGNGGGYGSDGGYGGDGNNSQTNEPPPSITEATRTAPTCQSAAANGNTSNWLGSFSMTRQTAGTARSMFGNFLLGTGPNQYFFGPNSAESQELSHSYLVGQAVSKALNGKTDGAEPFGVSDLFRSGGNMMQQYTGSFSWSASYSSGLLQLKIENTTSAWSFLYHRTHDFDSGRGNQPIAFVGNFSNPMMGLPMSTTSQTFVINFSCR